MFIIQATITKKTGGFSTTKQVPTFYLHEDVQGIVSAEHAEKIARSIIDPFGEYETHVHAALWGRSHV
jgi:hypothetical protein